AAGLLRRKERPPRPPIVRSKKPEKGDCHETPEKQKRSCDGWYGLCAGGPCCRRSFNVSTVRPRVRRTVLCSTTLRQQRIRCGRAKQTAHVPCATRKRPGATGTQGQQNRKDG